MTSSSCRAPTRRRSRRTSCGATYSIPTIRPGRRKARVFASLLGIAQDDWAFRRDQILQRVGSIPVTAVRPKPPHGTEYEVRIDVDGLNGATHPVITGWLVAGDHPPRLVTAYVDLPRRA